MIKYVIGQLQKLKNTLNLTSRLLTLNEDEETFSNKNIIRYCYDNGELLGFTVNGGLHLSGEKTDSYPTTYLAGHLWIVWAKNNNLKLYKKAIELIKDSIYLPKLKGTEFYKEEAIKAGLSVGTQEYENYFKEEALSKEIGLRGLQFASEARKPANGEWSSNLWSIIDKEPGLKNITQEELKVLNLEELCTRITADILKGDEL